ncbi:MAG TPA: hypothetical protein PLL64_02560 [Rhodothermales bacterium]|nr:hypothetical protein [Bacteroidota bacterium]HRK73130.1 hypothetical protein [Rhodothermales bacterium]HRR09525.1 hypothetical protein [Rhodothermales bacterium]
MKQPSLSAPSLVTWTRYTFYGWFLGVILILLFSSVFDGVGVEGMQFYLGLAMGAGIGVMQWWLLKKHGGISLKWVWFLILGLTIPFIAFDLLFQAMLPYKLAVCLTLGAILSGGLQTFVLLDYSPKAKWWVIYACSGWMLALGSILALDYTKLLSPYANNLLIAFLNLLLILAGGFILGVVTGTGLRKILHV